MRWIAFDYLLSSATIREGDLTIIIYQLVSNSTN